MDEYEEVEAHHIHCLDPFKRRYQAHKLPQQSPVWWWSPTSPTSTTTTRRGKEPGSVWETVFVQQVRVVDTQVAEEEDPRGLRLRIVRPLT